MKQLVITIMLCIPFISNAQNTLSALNRLHQVSKGENIMVIAKQYNVTEQAIRLANPEIKKNGKLKKGTYLIIPRTEETSQSETSTISVTKKEVPTNIKVGIILPFEEKTDRAKKMVEFYQGFLMAADSIKREGLNIDIYTYNSGTKEAEVMEILGKPEISTLDYLFGPVDEQQLPATISFCKQYNIKLVLPFTNGQSTSGNPQLYIACPNNAVTISEAASLVSKAYCDKNFIIFKSNNTNSKGNLFTQTLSDMLSRQGNTVRYLNKESDDLTYESVMNPIKDNVIVLDDPGIKSLNILVSKLDSFRQNHLNYNISLLGYPEWQTYTNTMLNNFFKFDTYTYSTYYYNALATNTKAFEHAFTKNFGKPMAVNFPRYAMMGFDLAYYFIHEFMEDGKVTGNQHIPYQNMYKFVKDTEDGGYSNRFVQLIHYTRNKQIELIR